MTNYKDILLNFCVGAAIFAAALLLAFFLGQAIHEELSVILAAVLVFPLSILLLKRLFPGREPVALAVCGLAMSAGMAGLSSAPYVHPAIQIVFFPAFLLVVAFLGYLAYALFSARQEAKNTNSLSGSFPPNTRSLSSLTAKRLTKGDESLCICAFRKFQPTD